MAIPWKPSDMPTLVAALPGGGRLIDFVVRCFGAEVQRRYDTPDGGVAHAEIRFGDSLLMTGDPMGDHTIPPGAVSVFVPDVDAAYRRALEAGATSREEPKDQFYGHRSARVIDPFGSQWWIATQVEEVSEEEMLRRMEQMGGG